MNINEFLKNKFDIDVQDEEVILKALTHPSYANEINQVDFNYERLEFMGDAILQFLISQYIYTAHPEYNEGQMTILRAKAVREDSLAMYSKEYGLDKYIRVGKGEKKSGGANKKSVLANVFESLLGALYLSNGLEVANEFAKIVYEAIEQDSFEDLDDYKTKLQEYVQADQKRTVTYDLVHTSGTSNNPVFTFKVKMDNLTLGEGTGTSKKKAQQNAAKDALEKLVDNETKQS